MSINIIDKDQYNKEVEKNKEAAITNYQELERLKNALSNLQAGINNTEDEALDDLMKKTEDLRKRIRYFSAMQNAIREQGKILQDVAPYIN